MQYVPLLLFFIITLVAYWISMNSFTMTSKNKDKKNYNFIPKLKFEGYKVGYVFKRADMGLGYYKD